MNIIVILQVLSWEERARILSKVWIVGIIVALVAVGIFLKIQHDKMKRQDLLKEKRSKKGKKDPVQRVEAQVFSAKSLEELFGVSTNGDFKYLAAIKADNLLGYVAFFNESKEKTRIDSLYLSSFSTDKTAAWMVEKLIAASEKSGSTSISYRVNHAREAQEINVLLAIGFKKVRLSKKEQAEGIYDLKYSY